MTQGPMAGIVDPASAAAEVAANGADGLITHRGWASSVVPVIGDVGYVVHLSASTTRGPDPTDKRLVCSVDRAVAGGADAVSVHVNVGSDTEPRQLVDLGSALEDAHDLGLPVLVMAYPRGPAVDEDDPEAIAHAVRVASELGADLIKTAVPDGPLTPAVDAAAAPVVVAGGTPQAPRATLEQVAAAMADGAVGVSMGRSIFQAADPGAMTRAIASIVHDGASPDDAVPLLDG